MDPFARLPIGNSSASSSREPPLEDVADTSIDDILKLIEDGPGARDQDVEELLQSLQPKEGSPFLAPTAAPGTPGSMKSLILDEEAEAQELDIPYDLPDPQRNLPPDIVPVPFIMVARFDLCCELDLKEVAFSIRHAEYNPRKHTSITVRLLNPRVTALVRHSGTVMLSSSAQSCSEEALKKSAKKVARLVQRAGNPTARFADYRISSILCKADLGFPVRLDQLATKFRRNALYEPEFFSNCVFRTKKPKCTYLITAGGKVSVSGLRTMDDVREALRRAYFVFREFRT